MGSKFYELFSKKPLIGMVHLLPLPGAPNYCGNIQEIKEAAFSDMYALIEGGADAFIIENFGDVPYENEMGIEAFAVMTSICNQLAEKCSIPFGINVQFNNIKYEWALSHALNADFVRIEAFVENRVGIHGITYAAAPEIMRLKSRYPAKTLIFADINTKHTFPLVDQPIDFSVHEAIESGADALIVTGLLTGVNPTLDDVVSIKKTARSTPVLLGSGINTKNAADYFKIADGAIVGSSLKTDGNVNNPVDINKVKEFAEMIRECREYA